MFEAAPGTAATMPVRTPDKQGELTVIRSLDVLAEPGDLMLLMGQHEVSTADSRFPLTSRFNKTLNVYTSIQLNNGQSVIPYAVSSGHYLTPTPGNHHLYRPVAGALQVPPSTRGVISFSLCAQALSTASHNSSNDVLTVEGAGYLNSYSALKCLVVRLAPFPAGRQLYFQTHAPGKVVIPAHPTTHLV